MRIGTWNIEGRWTPAHQDFVAALDCDVLLLTEVNDRTEIPGYQLHATEALVWGGDWNHALSGQEHAGSRGGRQHVLSALDELDLQAPTADLPHRITDILTIDHVAIGRSVEVVSAEHHVAASAGKRLSDHDAYVVEVG